MQLDQLWDYNDPAETEARFRALLPEAENTPAIYAELLTQIARAQGLQRLFAAAHQTLDEAYRLLTPEMKRAQARYLLERGRVFNSSGHADQAKPLFIEAWELAQAAGEDVLAVDAAHMIAIVESGHAAVEWNKTAVAYAEASPNPAARRWLGSLYNNLGWIYHGMAQYETALDYFHKALQFRQTQHDIEAVRIAQWCVARTLRSLGRIEEALAIQQVLLAEHEAAGATDAYVFEELGECLLALNRPEEARDYFAQAYPILAADPWFQANEAERLRRIRQLGESA